LKQAPGFGMEVSTLMAKGVFFDHLGGP
jgi:hypothetical protein